MCFYFPPLMITFRLQKWGKKLTMTCYTCKYTSYSAPHRWANAGTTAVDVANTSYTNFSFGSNRRESIWIFPPLLIYCISCHFIYLFFSNKQSKWSLYKCESTVTSLQYGFKVPVKIQTLHGKQDLVTNDLSDTASDSLCYVEACLQH